MDAILLGLDQVAAPAVLLALVAGAVIGILIGAVPGLEPAGAMAVLLPFTLAAVPTVDLSAGRIIADPPDGLF